MLTRTFLTLLVAGSGIALPSAPALAQADSASVSSPPPTPGAPSNAGFVGAGMVCERFEGESGADNGVLYPEVSFPLFF